MNFDRADRASLPIRRNRSATISQVPEMIGLDQDRGLPWRIEHSPPTRPLRALRCRERSGLGFQIDDSLLISLEFPS
jgi:hypothetical protein